MNAPQHTPAFSLEMQEPPPRSEQLTSWDQLVGQTVMAVFDGHETRNDDEVVIVTDTLCWLVIEPQDEGFGGDSDLLIEIVQDLSYGKPPKVLADYVKSRPLFEKGCITHAAYAELKAREDAEQAERDRARADRLRFELARLEGKTGSAA